MKNNKKYFEKFTHTRIIYNSLFCCCNKYKINTHNFSNKTIKEILLLQSKEICIRTLKEKKGTYKNILHFFVFKYLFFCRERVWLISV